MRSSPSFPSGNETAGAAEKKSSPSKPADPPEAHAAGSKSSRPPPPSIPSVPKIAPWEQVPGVTERPPMSMSTLPMDSVPPPPASQRPPVGPPVLASDILRDDVAPIAPAQRLIIAWLMLFAVAFGAAAVLSWIGFLPASLFLTSAITAALAACAALLPVPYALRALLAAVASLVPLVLGAQGKGVLATMRTGNDVLDLGTVVALTFLPGVLLFRSRYRAFTAARFLLAIALVASLPAELGLAKAVLDPASPLVARVADAIVFTAILGSSFGFMGAETTAYGAFFGAVIVTTHAAGIGLRAFSPLTDPAAWVTRKNEAFLAGGLGEWLAATLAAHAIFQLFAAVSAKAARRVDVHQIVGISAETASEPERIGEDERPEALGDD